MSKSKISVVVLLVFIFSIQVLAIASDSDPIEILHGHENAVQKIISLLEQGEERNAIEELDSLHSAVVNAKAELKGLSFEGKGPKLTDPFTLPSGVYRVHLTTEGTIRVVIHSIKKDAKEGILTPMPGQATEGASTIYRSNGDQIVLEFKGMTDPYKLVFEKLD